MRFGGRWRNTVLWWRGLPPFLRAGLLLLPVLLLALTLGWSLRPKKDPSSRSPTPVGVISAPSTVASTGEPALLLNDDRLFYEPGWGALEVRAFLEERPGVLGRLGSWVGDQEVPLADLIAGQAFLYGVNPRVLLTMLEMQSGLVDNPHPSPEDLDWAMGYHDEEVRGLEAQISWAAKEVLRSTREYPLVSTLALGDGSLMPLPVGTNLGSYAVMRVLGQTGEERLIEEIAGVGEKGFVPTYQRLFGEDPRTALTGLPSPVEEPFLVQPYEGTYEVTSILDHHYPLLGNDGLLLSRWGADAQGLPYDDHDGWDYALDLGTPVLAAADGVVAWAGNSDDGCATVARGVVLDHGNGYHTLYWHLDQVEVEIGGRVSAGERIGLAGASGCAVGPHLHFGVYFWGRRTDPEGWCGPGEDPWTAHPAGTDSRWLWADRFSPCRWPAGAIVVDSSDPDFQRSGTRWFEGGGGIGGSAWWAPSEPRSGVVPVGQPGDFDGIVEAGTWRPDLPRAGRYHLYAFVPYWYNNTPDTQAALYLVSHAEGETRVPVDQALYVDRWANLGTFSFEAGRQGFVYLNNLTDETGFGVWFDAIMWLRE